MQQVAATGLMVFLGLTIGFEALARDDRRKSECCYKLDWVIGKESRFSTTRMVDILPTGSVHSLPFTIVVIEFFFLALSQARSRISPTNAVAN